MSSGEANISATLLAPLWATTALLVFHNTKGWNKGWTNVPWPEAASKLRLPRRDHAASCRLSSVTVQNQLLAPWGSLSAKARGTAGNSGDDSWLSGWGAPALPESSLAAGSWELNQLPHLLLLLMAGMGNAIEAP